MKFKPGDKVKRIEDEWENMKVGDVATVSRLDFSDEDIFYLKGYIKGHDPTKFTYAEGKLDKLKKELLSKYD